MRHAEGFYPVRPIPFMRTPSAAIACILLLCGCMSAPSSNEASSPRQVLYAEDFSKGAVGWDIRASGGAMAVESRPNLGVDKALVMRSQLEKSAYATSPKFGMDWGRDYIVSFDFMLQHRDNFGFTLYRDPNADIRMGDATLVFCNGGKTRVGRFEPNAWQKVEVDVRPSAGEYTVSVNGGQKTACKTVKAAGLDGFVVGDEDGSAAVHGDGMWDNIAISSLP
jgi:hypothetical protein